jgi:hypothetical protein
VKTSYLHSLGVIFLRDSYGAGMSKKSNNPEVTSSTVTKRGGKFKTLEALNQLGWTLQKLVHQQGILSESKNHSIRLSLYDDSMEELVGAFETLAVLLQVKQAGGRKLNLHFSMAYEIVKDHYKETSDFLSAKSLVKTVNQKLSSNDEISDKDGNESFSERLAGDCIRFFKTCLPFENFDNK